MTSPVPRELFADDSREFTLACEPDGTITWLDARAGQVLRTAPGARLQALATPGSEAKVAEFLRAARDGHQRGWEIPLVIDRAPATVLFAGAPHNGGIALHGTLLPQSVANAITQLNESMEEIVELNRESARQRHEIKRQADQLRQINEELTESNRGIIALHNELEDKSASIQRNADVKQRLLSTVSHEFRTPIHSILGLSRLLLDNSDGHLSGEQAKQVGFIRTSAETLLALVNDLLDLSKLEAGRLGLRVERVSVPSLFGSLRGTLRPLLPAGSPVRLEFDEPQGLPELETDESKVSQILRNLVSNALKFTEQGEVRVSAAITAGKTVTFSVTDTGIGIDPDDQERVFDEFSQIDGPLQRGVKGTGLGLPLSRQLATLLGGTLTVTSAVGRGSTFSLTLPVEHPEVVEEKAIIERSREPAPGRAPVLVVEDDRQTLFLYERYLSRAGFQVIPARTVEGAQKLLQSLRPAAVVLDVMLEGDSSWRFLSEIKANPQTRDIPVCVVTVTNKEQKARALGADEFWLKPLDPDRLLRKLQAMARVGPMETLLIIDDDPTARYLLKKMLAGTTFQLLEASSGPEGVALARQAQPQLIILDFVLQDMTAFDVLDELKTDDRTRHIPVVINTSKDLNEQERSRLAAETAAILSKQSLSRELAISRIRDALEKAGVSSSRTAPKAG